MSIHQHPLTRQEFEEFHNRYHDRLLNSMTAAVGNRDAAEDITAAGFAAAFEKLETFRGGSSPYTWLHAIALNEARRRWRERPTAPLELQDGRLRRDAAEPDIAIQTLERSECLARLHKVMRRVPAEYRKLLVDHVVRGYRVREVARRQRIPLGTALSRIFRAKQLLRSAWEV